MTASNNPLLNNLNLPLFDQIEPQHIQPAIDTLIQNCEAQLANLEQNINPSWDDLIRPLEDMGRQISSTWGPISHLVNVKNSPELREAYNATLPKVVAFGLKYSQSRPIYEGLKALQKSPEWHNLSRSRQRIIEKKIQEAEFSGIGLEGEKQKKFNEISQKLSELANQFSNHVLDATKDFELVIDQAQDVEGVPRNFLALWAEAYQQRHPNEAPPTRDQGPWSVTLDYASFEPFLKYCKNRALREKVYRAHVTKASKPPFDNTPLLYEILKLRRQLAQLLGFHTFAELSLAKKMAGDVPAVDKLLTKLRDASRQHAIKEMNELATFAKDDGLQDSFKNWDFYFYSEKLRQKLFDFSDEAIRPYFPLPKVLSGLFDLVQKLFGISVRASQEKVPTWHRDVTYYDIFDENGQKIAGFYLDPYSRPENKRGGAWMDTCIDRGFYQGKFYRPVAYLVCNGTPPSKTQPSMLSFREVETLFHEFGHGLQHMLTKIDESSAAGINGIEWDAVELPSQFMENWCYHKPILLSLTQHIETGEPLPDELFQKIANARTFQAAYAMVRQLHFGMIDLELHHRFDPSSDDDIFVINHKIASQVTALPPVPEDRFLCSFSHIFAGGYAAGYYSYKWAEVLSADAFSRFEEQNLDNEDAIERIGREFRDSILALGGSEHPMEVFRSFRGREPEIDALLRHSGLSL